MPEVRNFPHKRYIIFYFPIDDGVEIYRVLRSAWDIEEVFEGFVSDLPSTE